MIHWLRRFGPRLQQQLNVVAGIVGVGAVALALAGFLASGTPRTVLVAAGAATAGIMILVGVVRAWPPKALKPADVAGRDLPIAELPSIYPRVPALGIIGAGAVGKTTLKQRILQLPTSDQGVTQKVTFHISPLLHNHTAYIALIDGRGESYDQQFKIANQADIILVLVDHNDIETTGSNADRLTAHRAFGVQIRNHLSRDKSPKGAVHVLLNKKDLWQGTGTADQQKIRQFFASEVGLWEAAFGERVSSAEHSNDVPNDTANLVKVIDARWAEIRP
jgi:hypothetical protein